MATSLLTRVKARVDLHTSNRARGLIQGRGRSMFKGSGEDFDDLKYYQPGDKISDIDEEVSATSDRCRTRSSLNWRISGSPERAVACQSMSEILSPGWWNFRQSTCLPLPFNIDRPSPW